MKRSPLKRKKPLQSRSRPMARSKPLPKVNRRRLAKRRAVQFGEQADLCRHMPCCACMPGLFAPHAIATTIAHAQLDRGQGFRRSDPHHTRTRGAGGIDRDCVPLCRRHHDELDAPGSGPKTFEREHGVGLRAIADALHDHLKGATEHAA